MELEGQILQTAFVFGSLQDCKTAGAEIKADLGEKEALIFVYEVEE